MSKIGRKLDSIYRDLSANVTYIYERQNLHLSIDLVYHSPLQIYFEGVLRKGYPECLIIGDTKCGKTETAEKLMRHYKLGAIATGETSTWAGLVASVQQVRNKWEISWGKIPFNNGRLLFIDEVSGLSVESIAAMSGIRQSGVATIDKVKSGKAEARTRLVWIANTRKGINIDHYSNGIKIIEDLIGKEEDIARFDFAIILTAKDIDEDTINAPAEHDVEHVYTSQACHDLVMWAWTRKPGNIKISSATLHACRDRAKYLYKKYSQEFGLIKASEQKLKLARMSASLACRLFSTENGNDVIVTPDHVEYITEFLDTEYSKPSFAYDAWARSKTTVSTISEENRENVLDRLRSMGAVIVMQLLDQYHISLKGLADITASDDSEARIMIHEWVQCGALKPYSSYYVKNPGLIRIMKEYLNDPNLQKQREEEY